MSSSRKIKLSSLDSRQWFFYSKHGDFNTAYQIMHNIFLSAVKKKNASIFLSVKKKMFSALWRCEGQDCTPGGLGFNVIFVATIEFYLQKRDSNSSLLSSDYDLNHSTPSTHLHHVYILWKGSMRDEKCWGSNFKILFLLG